MAVDYDLKGEQYDKNMKHAKKLQDQYGDLATLAKSGGGEKAIKRHIEKQKKMMVLDRVQAFLDDPDDFLELSLTAGIGMEYGNVPRSGVMTGESIVTHSSCKLLQNKFSLFSIFFIW